MALNTLKCNCLTPLHFKWLNIRSTHLKLSHYVRHNITVHSDKLSTSGTQYSTVINSYLWLT